MSTSLTKKAVETVARAASPTLSRSATLVIEHDISEPARKRLKRDDTSATSILAGEESQLALQSIGTNVFIDEQYSQTVVETQSSTADVSIDTKAKGKRGGRAKKGSEPDESPANFPPRSDLEWKIGAHISAAGGVEESIINGAKIGFVVYSMAFDDY
jgi:AP endonuclease-1